MYQVTKRDGKIAEFNLVKISEAIRKAFEAQEKQYNQDIIDLLALKVTADFEPKIKDELVSVEDIQDSVESVLIKAGYADVAKGYILYRKQREKIRNLNSTLLDYKEIVDSYVKITDWRVKENSTVTYSVGGLILSNSGAITANYWLSEIYDEEIGKAHKNADIHKMCIRDRYPFVFGESMGTGKLVDQNFHIVHSNSCCLLFWFCIDCLCADSGKHAQLSGQGADDVAGSVKRDTNDRNSLFPVRNSHSADNVGRVLTQ